MQIKHFMSVCRGILNYIFEVVVNMAHGRLSGKHVDLDDLRRGYQDRMSLLSHQQNKRDALSLLGEMLHHIAYTQTDDILRKMEPVKSDMEVLLDYTKKPEKSESAELPLDMSDLADLLIQKSIEPQMLHKLEPKKPKKVMKHPKPKGKTAAKGKGKAPPPATKGKEKAAANYEADNLYSMAQYYKYESPNYLINDGDLDHHYTYDKYAKNNSSFLNTIDPTSIYVVIAIGIIVIMCFCIGVLCLYFGYKVMHKNKIKNRELRITNQCQIHVK
eukprot:454137_1